MSNRPKEQSGGNRNEPNETKLYEFNNGQVLITNKRIKLGPESWPIEAVEDAELVKNEVLPAKTSVGDLNLHLSDGIALGSIMGLVGVLLFAYMQLSKSYSNVLLCLVILLITAGLGIMLYTLQKPHTVYKVRLKTESIHSKYSWRESSYIWKDRLVGEEIVRAIQEVIAMSNRPT